MLGKSICDRNGDTFEALSLADFYTYQGGESYKKYISANPNDTELIKNDTRITGDVIFKADFIEKPLVGFVNKCGFIKGNFNPLFNVVYGIGNNRNDKSDGIRINNILGTYLYRTYSCQKILQCWIMLFHLLQTETLKSKAMIRKIVAMN